MLVGWLSGWLCFPADPKYGIPATKARPIVKSRINNLLHSCQTVTLLLLDYSRKKLTEKLVDHRIHIKGKQGRNKLSHMVGLGPQHSYPLITVSTFQPSRPLGTVEIATRTLAKLNFI